MFNPRKSLALSCDWWCWLLGMLLVSVLYACKEAPKEQPHPQSLSLALVEAAIAESETEVKRLAQAGIDVNAVDEGEGTALYAVIEKRGTERAVALLLDGGASRFLVPKKDRARYPTFAHFAAGRASDGILKKLVQAGLNINERAPDLSTALHSLFIPGALRNTIPGRAALLLEIGADKDLRDERGYSALDNAVRAAVNIELDPIGEWWDLESNIVVCGLRALIAAGADLNKRPETSSDDRRTPAEILSELGLKELVTDSSRRINCPGALESPFAGGLLPGMNALTIESFLPPGVTFPDSVKPGGKIDLFFQYQDSRSTPFQIECRLLAPSVVVLASHYELGATGESSPPKDQAKKIAYITLLPSANLVTRVQVAKEFGARFCAIPKKLTASYFGRRDASLLEAFVGRCPCEAS